MSIKDTLFREELRKQQENRKREDLNERFVWMVSKDNDPLIPFISDTRLMNHVFSLDELVHRHVQICIIWRGTSSVGRRRLSRLFPSSRRCRSHILGTYYQPMRIHKNLMIDMKLWYYIVRRCNNVLKVSVAKWYSLR